MIIWCGHTSISSQESLCEEFEEIGSEVGFQANMSINIYSF